MRQHVDSKKHLSSAPGERDRQHVRGQAPQLSQSAIRKGQNQVLRPVNGPRLSRGHGSKGEVVLG
jgi:hypothetical protein